VLKILFTATRVIHHLTHPLFGIAMLLVAKMSLVWKCDILVYFIHILRVLTAF